VLASSASVYGVGVTGLVDESAIPSPTNDYVTSKLAMESMAATYQQKLSLVIERPFNYTGVGQGENYLVPKIVGHFRRGEAFLELGNLEVAREFNDVRMVADAYVRLLHVAPGTIVNVCTGISHRLLDVVEIASRLAGHRLRIDIDPALVRIHEVPILAGNPARFRSLVGEMHTYSLEDTIQWMLSA
jgi:nucleoside-diphosphate-sugar epimerase